MLCDIPRDKKYVCSIASRMKCLISRARRCIRHGGHALADELIDDCFLTTSVNVLTIEHINAS